MSVPVRAADLGPAAHGVFTTAHGGVSTPPWAAAASGGLNLGPHVGDDPGHVRANRERVTELVGGPVAWMTQVHGTAVRIVAGAGAGATAAGDTPAPTAGEAFGETVGEADVLVALPRAGETVSVGVMVADCVPLLLADGAGRAAAAVHVGRAGLVAGAVPAALEALADAGVAPSDLSAHLGPSICGRCYEVPAPLRDEVAAVHPAAGSTTRDGTPGLDVAAAVHAQLDALGVTRVTREHACTYEDEALYSYRRATHAGERRTGRFAGIVTVGAGLARRVEPATPTSSS
ncbi:polyphenol oxidase family protein [Georgenia sp. Z1344]|uniref:polyphenol oxidase family protein n=1 Tax=Georgenia sp. Z1344 TaxID=3416706 RepID=UPI003CFA927E